MVNCYQCKKRITDPEDINVLAFLGIALRAFCNNCYTSKERGFWRRTLYVGKRTPINSLRYFLMLIMLTLVAPFMLFMAFTKNEKDAGIWSAFFGSSALLVISAFAAVLIIGGWLLWFGAGKMVKEAERK